MLTQLTEELHDLCERVVGGAPTLQRRVRGANGSWFLVRIVPYLKDGGEAGGAVITVTNVTGVLAGMEQAIIERQHAKMILNTVGTTLLEGCLREGKEFEAFEVEREFPSIGRKTVLLTARPLPREPKDEPSLLLTIEDVSARRRAEAALKESERQLSDFFENGAVGL